MAAGSAEGAPGAGMIAAMSESAVAAAPHVLVVDDETVLAGMVANYLQRAGFRTSVAHDGVRAVEVRDVTEWDAGPDAAAHWRARTQQCRFRHLLPVPRHAGALPER